jgi:Replication-relaxation
MPPDIALAPARTKHRPRFRRAPQDDRPAFRLTDRDREMLKIIYEYRFITAAMLQDLVTPVDLTEKQQEALAKLRAYKQAMATASGTAEGFQPKTRREILRRLQMLYHAGYVQRQKLSDSDPIIYSLGNLGADELMLYHGIDRKQIEWTTKARESTDRYIRHGLVISRFRHALELALREFPTVTLESWIPSGGFTAQVTYQDTVQTREGKRTHLVDGVVKPDGLFVLKVGEKRIHCFFEADRSTMTNARYLGKLRSYFAFYATYVRGEKKAGITQMRVLSVTISEARKDNLRETAQKVSTEAKDLFWFACERPYREEPTQVLSPIWQTLSADTLRSLIA